MRWMFLNAHCMGGRAVRSCLLKLAGWLLAWGIIGQIAALSASSPEAQALAFSNSVLADFDGDARWDLALGYPERHEYRIRIHLSRRASAVLLRMSVREAGLVLLALDVNRDAHPDLVVAGAHLARPLAVWINDGRGSFRRGKARGWIFRSSWAVGYRAVSSPRLEIAVGLEDRWPLDRPLWPFIISLSECPARLPFESARSLSSLFVIPCLGRSPPWPL